MRGGDDIVTTSSTVTESSPLLTPAKTQYPPSTTLTPSEVTTITEAPEIIPTSENPALKAVIDLISKKLDNTVKIESKKLLPSLPVIETVIELLQNSNIDVSKLVAIKEKIKLGQQLTPTDLLELITFLYTNRKILTSGQIDLKPLLGSVLDLVIGNIPGSDLSPVKIGANVSKNALLALV
jgi:hypothetical protein